MPLPAGTGAPPGVGAAGVLAFEPEAGLVLVAAAWRPAGVLLAAALLAAGLELAAEPDEADGEDGVAGLLAAGAEGFCGLADGLSALGVDEPAVGAGEPAWLVSALDFDEAFLEEPPEQAPPSNARVL